MDEARFDFLLPAITSTTSYIIAENLGITPEEAFERFVTSELYTYLEVEDTKVWHLSPHCLAEIFIGELNGRLEFPDVIRWPISCASRHTC